MFKNARSRSKGSTNLYQMAEENIILYLANLNKIYSVNTMSPPRLNFPSDTDFVPPPLQRNLAL